MTLKYLMIQTYINAGFIPTPLNGKVPVKEGWQKTQYDLEFDPREYPENFGLVLQDDDLVIDIDPRNYSPGDQPYKRLEKDFGIDRGACVVVQTGGGGWHVYFKKDPNIQVKGHYEAYPGVEFKSRGTQVVGAGCVHPDSGKEYRLIYGRFTAIPEAPYDLVETIKAVMGKHEHEDEDEQDFTNYEEDQKRYIEYLKLAPFAIEGEQGDAQTYKIACEAYNFNLSRDTALELIAEHYNPRCIPPWNINDLARKVDNAYDYAQGAPGFKIPEKDFQPLPAKAVDKYDVWDKDVHGKYKKTIRNVVNWFCLNRSELKETLVYDEFRGQVMIVKSLPWREVLTPSQWKEHDSVELRYFLCHKWRFDAQIKLINEAVVVAARKKIIHPVKDYLTNLKWDGMKRLDTWLVKYTGALDNLYVRDAGAKVLMQAVARVYQPGCKVDTVLVLEGKQGIGKSKIVRILGGPYFSEFPVDPHSRDTVDAMRGAWFIEFSEMEVARRADMQALKAFITRQVDRARLAYAAFSVDYPRHCIFMGTFNPNATGEYLPDETGNRRFLPINVTQIDHESLARDRDQLFAEAAERFLKGELTYITSPEVLDLASGEQEKRRFHEPWTDIIGEYLETDELAQKFNFTTVRELWLFAIKGSEGQMNRQSVHRIAEALRDLGWESATQRHPVSKKPTKCFSKKGVKTDATSDLFQ